MTIEHQCENCVKLKAEVSDYATSVLKLIATVKYLVGIAERGTGTVCPDTETAERFVLGYVKAIEAERDALTADRDNGWKHSAAVTEAAIETQNRLTAELENRQRQMYQAQEAAIKLSGKCAAVTTERDALAADAARYQKLVSMEASMVADNIIAHYIQHPERLDAAIKWEAEAKESKCTIVK